MDDLGLLQPLDRLAFVRAFVADTHLALHVDQLTVHTGQIATRVEQGLLKRADAEARRRKISRAQLVARGLEAVLSRRSA